MSIECCACQQLQEIQSRSRALLVEELDVHGLLWLVVDGDSNCAIRPSSSILNCLDRLVANALVEEQPRVVLVRKTLVRPLEEVLLVEEIQYLVLSFRVDERHTRPRLNKAASIFAHDVFQLLLVLSLEVTLNSRLNVLFLASQPLRAGLAHLKAGILVLPLDVDVNTTSRLLRLAGCGCCAPRCEATRSGHRPRARRSS
mmetsp:Transcript_44393/g.80419  ORF Transcript_44393/g.80419 Transcript_44393/m.80419 type:complete len:200 (-) Transcript_44393:62-661(-)